MLSSSTYLTDAAALTLRGETAFFNSLRPLSAGGVGKQRLRLRGLKPGHHLACTADMDSAVRGKAFLEGGLWVPLATAGPLSHVLQLLHAWVTTPRPRDPTAALLVHLKVTRLEHLLEAGIRHHRLVPVDEWKRAVGELQGLTTWLAATR